MELEGIEIEINVLFYEGGLIIRGRLTIITCLCAMEMDKVWRQLEFVF